MYAPEVELWLKEHGSNRHECKGAFGFECYEWAGFKLLLSSDGGYECEVNFCPFCGFASRK